jgi:hypothetical protein
MIVSSEQELSTSTKLAIDRTRLAHERTLMAWVRTATSLISFGFTVYKFFQYLQESQGVAVKGAIGPREFAALMIGIGITALPGDHWAPAQYGGVTCGVRSADPVLTLDACRRLDRDPRRRAARRGRAPDVTGNAKGCS